MPPACTKKERYINAKKKGDKFKEMLARAFPNELIRANPHRPNNKKLQANESHLCISASYRRAAHSGAEAD
jgi:hypothetical protein